MRKFFALIVLVLAIPALAGQATYLIRVNLKKGQVIRHAYTMTTTLPMGTKPMKMDISATLRQTVLNTANGKFTIAAKMESAKVKSAMLGAEQAKTVEKQMMAATTTLTMDPLGKTTVAGGKNAMAGVNTTTTYPKAPIRVGQSWTTSQTMPTQMGNLDMTVTSKLLAVEKVGANNCYKLGMSMKSAGQIKINGNGIMWVRMTDGMQEKANITMNMTMGTGKQAMNMTLLTGMNRL